MCNNLSCESYLLEKSQILRFINCTEYCSQLSFLQGFFVAGPRGRSGRKHHGKRWQHFNNHVLTTTYTNNKSLKPGLTIELLLLFVCFVYTRFASNIPHACSPCWWESSFLAKNKLIFLFVLSLELQSQTITLDSGFLFPHTPCPMLFCSFKKISKEKSTSLYFVATLKEGKRGRAFV